MAAKRVVMAALVLCLIGSARAEPPTCDMEKMDECASHVIPYAKGNPLPLEGDELTQSCNRVESSLKCLSDMSTSGCIRSGIASGVLKVLVEGVERASGQRCQGPDNPDFATYSRYVPCLNEVASGVHQCIATMNGEVAAAGQQPPSERVAATCCSFQKLDKCVREAAAAKCSADHQNYVSEMLKGISEEAVESVCNRFKGKACNKHQVTAINTSRKTMIPGIMEALSV